MSDYTNEIKSSEVLSLYLTKSKDSSAANQTAGKQAIQHYYTFLMSQAENYVLEKTKYGDLKATQRSYLTFPDYIKMKNVRIKDGDFFYPLTEVTNIDEWHQRIMYNQTSNRPDSYIILNENGQMYVELDPIPNTNVTGGLEMVYEGRHDPLSFPSDYSTGTITVENGSHIVEGSGVTWTQAMVGRFIKVDKWWYEVQSVQDSDSLTLTNYYQEADASGASYEMAELMRLPPEYHLTPLWGALEDYWELEDKELAKKYGARYARELLLLQNQYRSKSKGNIQKGTRVGVRRTGNVPRNYPTSAIG